MPQKVREVRSGQHMIGWRLHAMIQKRLQFGSLRPLDVSKSWRCDRIQESGEPLVNHGCLIFCPTISEEGVTETDPIYIHIWY